MRFVILVTSYTLRVYLPYWLTGWLQNVQGGGMINSIINYFQFPITVYTLPSAIILDLRN